MSSGTGQWSGGDQWSATRTSGSPTMVNAAHSLGGAPPVERVELGLRGARHRREEPRASAS